VEANEDTYEHYFLRAKLDYIIKQNSELFIDCLNILQRCCYFLNF